MTQFVRTQNWYLPVVRASFFCSSYILNPNFQANRPIGDRWRWAFRYIPLLTRIYRIFLFFRVSPKFQGKVLLWWLIHSSVGTELFAHLQECYTSIPNDEGIGCFNYISVSSLIMVQVAKRYMLKTCPKQYQEQLIPTYRKLFITVKVTVYWKLNIHAS